MVLAVDIAADGHWACLQGWSVAVIPTLILAIMNNWNDLRPVARWLHPVLSPLPEVGRRQRNPRILSLIVLRDGSTVPDYTGALHYLATIICILSSLQYIHQQS